MKVNLEDFANKTFLYGIQLENIHQTYYHPSKEMIHRAWATQAGLENWFLRLAEFTKPDGRTRDGNEQVKRETNTNGFGGAMMMQLLRRKKFLIQTGQIRCVLVSAVGALLPSQ